MQANVEELLIFPCHSPNPRVSPDPGPGSPAWLPQASALCVTHREIHSSGISPCLAAHFGCLLHGIRQLSGLSVNIIWRNNIKRDI